MPFCPYCDFQIQVPDAEFCPSCGKAIAPPLVSRQNSFQGHPAPQSHDLLPVAEEPGGRWLLLPGEQIVWEKDFKEGLIHRHVERAYVITNQRVVAIDIVNRSVISSLPLRETEIVVMDRHYSSTSTSVGSYHGGAGVAVRTGRSTSIGTLVFLVDGKERIRVGGIGDPDGVKNLFTSLKRQAI
ncbi:MAG TPA: zinc ribbon domain-containing protein [Nitrososphaerales archaeon]|nr:zinc ribbon domain-containing protein [Nitrososphaerales archaeon]